ncbi:fatty-acid--CoA ligase [Geobacillus subterraneus]|uniref:Fatty-acid--CoA ligase n=2 Tax=Geobacillus TaxID=129337 RepID=A0ABM6ACB3_9BACL|nr:MULTISPECIES: long-chain fatty acid--CoA ligase [Geobacillus]AMX83945.1 fatty-acid--CoA ligase [Geobacillus subterraneus]KZS26736.1 fatty-acid--CoA ligase [Geobacillus subterraneus]OXB88149.1 fatty-acid--CoA ligase [Geobacillus uzenensis]WPZ19608.1 long-chain fatty acid--CoA ligase [Geobacillus subterraneus]
MMKTPLNISMMLERAEMFFPKKQVISRMKGGVVRHTYKEIGARTRRLASVLKQLGVEVGDRVGTFAWNHHRHLEAYFAIPGIGAVLHTINIRLSAQHIAYIINHADDRVLLIDDDLLPAIEAVKDEIPNVRAFIIMTDADELPETTLSPVYHYEKLLAEGDPTFPFFKDLDEYQPAGMCYTSATTGNPKGVVYTHRSTVLHAMALGLADTQGLCERDVIMPVVPMFHVNAWGLPFAATWFGSTIVMPGPAFTPKVLAELIDAERVTITAGVPTIWLGLLQELEKGNYDVKSLTRVICGGSAAPKGVIRAFEEKYGIPFIHAYGMTETSPLVLVSRPKSYQDALSYEEKLDIRAKQGLLAPGLEMKVIGQNGPVRWDGQEMGELCLRGPWIAAEYYNDDRTKDAFRDGWLHTGDVVTVDEEGFVKIVDRTKDVIKSGGEWISSVDLENALMAHEAVFEAAVVAVPHPKWQERPIACVVLKEGKRVTKEELYDFLRPQFTKWWLPDDIVFLDEIPKTSVGKFLKRKLRDEMAARYADAAAE